MYTLCTGENFQCVGNVLIQCILGNGIDAHKIMKSSRLLILFFDGNEMFCFLNK